MESSEIKKNVNKIKELLKSEDFDVVNTGLELVRSLDEEAVYEKLLEGCGVNEEGKLVNEKKEISDYLVCSLSSISNGRKAKEILDNVTNLNLGWDESLINVDGLANLTKLTKLRLAGCTSLTNTDGLANLTNLTDLSLNCCKSLTNVDALANLTNLTSLDLSSCESLTNIDGLANLTNLPELDLSKCTSLTNIDGLANLTNLTDLTLGSESLTNIDGLANLTKLTKLKLAGCTSLTNTDGLANLTNLTDLSLNYCKSLTNIDGLANLTNLTNLDLSSCESLTNIDGLANLTNLPELDLRWDESLTNVDGLANLTNLTTLRLSSYLLTHFDELEASTNIITLDFSGDNMTELPVVPEFFKNIKELILDECYDLEDLEGLVNFPNISYLDLSCCFENDREEMIREWGTEILPFPSLEVLTKLKKLKKLDLSSSEYHHDLSPVLFLDNLNELILGCLGSGAEKIYDWLNNETEPKLANLTKLELMYCESLTNVNGLANLPNLNSLRLDGCYSINVIPDGYNKQVLEDQEDVVVEGEELKSYLQKIREHSDNKLIDQRISSNNKSVDQKNKEIQVTLFARELTFCDLEFEESEISSIDKIQNLIDEVIEFSDEERTSHMILGSFDNNNKQKLSEKRYSAKSYYKERSFKISINNLGNLVNEPSQKKIKLIHYYYYDNASYILHFNGLNKELLIDVKNFDSEAVILHHSTKNYELELLYANTGGLYRIACIFYDGHIIKGTISEKSKFIDEVFKYHKNK